MVGWLVLVVGCVALMRANQSETGPVLVPADESVGGKAARLRLSSLFLGCFRIGWDCGWVLIVSCWVLLMLL